jgi:hypothetical protein
MHTTKTRLAPAWLLIPAAVAATGSFSTPALGAGSAPDPDVAPAGAPASPPRLRLDVPPPPARLALTMPRLDGRRVALLAAADGLGVFPSSRALVASDAPAPAPAAEGSAPASAPERPPSNEPSGGGMPWERTVAIVSGGVAIAAVVGGTVYGALAFSRKSSAQSVCPGTTTCPTQDGVNRWNSADSAANTSTVLFIAAAFLALEAAVFWITPTEGDTRAPQVGLGPGAVQLRGTFR